MLTLLPGYQISSLIYESTTSFIYRGYREKDDRSVILKVLKPDYCTPTEIERYQREYSITHRLNIEGVVKTYNLEKYQNTLVMILEDFGGTSLKSLIQEREFSLSDFLTIAIQTAETLGQVHAASIIHKDLNSSNILFNAETGQVKLIDFGISAGIASESTPVSHLRKLEGTLAYISPEQTARMNRSLDYRTDFYSLGVTFYELLTRQLPFETTDAMELVHSHIALTPKSPHELNPGIPQAISGIVMKMLAKTPEERYQSAWGIQADLVLCLMQLEATGLIEPLVPGENDVTNKLKFPQQLYSKGQELDRLLDAFKRVSNSSNSRTRIMLVSGYSGIGKSTLVAEIRKPVTKKKGHFILVNFKPVQQNCPYSAIVEALGEFVRQLLMETESKLRNWRERLVKELSDRAMAIVEVIPEVKLIVGEPPELPVLEQVEAQKRFESVLNGFIRGFCTKESPMVLVLDDLQWADVDSLKLIEKIVTDSKLRHLLLIGVYRSNEVKGNHPLTVTLERLKEQHTTIEHIHLEPLETDSIAQLLADTLHSDLKSVKPLAGLVKYKTNGNPFFIQEFLKTLHVEKLLVFDEESISWQWDIAQIEAMGITDNVVGLMISKLKSFPESTQKVLALGACIGNDFDINLVSAVYQQPVSETFQSLMPALIEGLIQPKSELESNPAYQKDSLVLLENYKFLHDRVQRAANSIFDNITKKKVHYQIGETLLKQTQYFQKSKKIYKIVYHLNLSIDILESQADKIKLVELNLEAARKAKEELKYELARDYLISGIESCPEEIWTSRRDLAFEIHKERAKIEYLNGNIEESLILVQHLLNQSNSSIERAEFETILISQYTLKSHYDRAIELGKLSLHNLGFNFSILTDETIINAELKIIDRKLRKHKILNFIAWQFFSDPAQKAIVQLLASLESSSFFIDPNLFALAIAKTIDLSLTYGQTPELVTALAGYGILQNSILGNPIRGYELADMAVELSEKMGALYEKCKACLKLGMYLMPWVKPMDQSLAVLNEGYKAGVESGNLQDAGYTIAAKLLVLFYAGTNLEYLLSEIPKFLSACHQATNQWAIDVILASQIPILRLCNRTQVKLNFHNGEISEFEYLETCQRHKSFAGICLYQIHKSQVLYLDEEYAEALRSLQEAKQHIGFLWSSIAIAEHQFYTALSLAALYPFTSESQQQQYWQELEAIQAQMKCWMEGCPENFRHQFLLISAEMARISGKELEAIDFYDFSIEAASQGELIQKEAVANERAAQFWLGKGKEKIASLYLNEAYEKYQLWGASRKVEKLEKKYAYLLAPYPVYPKSSNPLSLNALLKPSATLNSTRTRAGVLDLAAVTKAAQALSGEIVLSQLLDKLMQTIVANAGATTGCLILARDDRLTVEAAKTVGSEAIIVQQSLPVDQSDRLPLSVINYVARTHERVVFSNAAAESAFASDPYIQVHQPKSILCAPILGQGQPIGIVYLENHLTSEAFTDDRLDVLMLLCAQAAIALENARLYQDLQQSEMREREKAEELTQSLKDLKEAQLKLVQGEKMASLGQLVAGVAHEINNPVGFIAANISHAQGYIADLIGLLELYQETHPKITPEIEEEIEEIDLEFILDDLPKLLKSMDVGTERIRQISKSLRTFCRHDASTKMAVDLHEGIESTLMILKHRLKANAERPTIEIVREYGELPLVECYGGQLNQVFMNIIANAIDALEESNQGLTYAEIEKNPNRIKIETNMNEAQDRVIVQIEDNGPGMPEEVKQQIFEHLFSTKPMGKGTGLGLSISHQIVVEKHGGKLNCYSRVGQGTQFAIEIPIA